MDDQQTPQEFELSTTPDPDESTSKQREIFEKAKDKIDRALDEARDELGELAEEAKEEFQELKEKAPEWIRDARRKVADFLEPDEPAKPTVEEPPKDG